MKTVHALGAVPALAGIAFFLGCATFNEDNIQFSAGRRKAEFVHVTPGPAGPHEAAATQLREDEARMPIWRKPEHAGMEKIHRSHVAGMQTRRPDAISDSVTPLPSVAQPRLPSQAKRASGAEKGTAPIEELIRWLS